VTFDDHPETPRPIQGFDDEAEMRRASNGRETRSRQALAAEALPEIIDICTRGPRAEAASANLLTTRVGHIVSVEGWKCRDKGVCEGGASGPVDRTSEAPLGGMSL